MITLIPKWIGSPKKKQLRKQNRSASYDDKFHCKVESENMKARVTGKSRFNYMGRNKKDMGYCRNMAKTDGASDWELYTFNNVKNRRPNHWPTGKETIHKSNATKLLDSKRRKDSEQCLENNQDLWLNEADDNMHMYEDLLDDIRELLNSPEPQEDTVALMNLANMRDTGRKSFIQCGTNITSSIWSTNIPVQDESSENTFNAALASQNSDVLLGIKFSSISIGSNDGWPSSDAKMVAENKTNIFFENCSKSNNDFLSLPWDSCTFTNLEKWSDAECYEDEIVALHNITAKSLIKLNHHKEKSSFTEVIPRSAPRATSSSLNKSTVCKADAASKKVEAEKDKDDLLTSVRSHFKPINEKFEFRGQQYADGTSFVIPNALDKINYKRSESGTMYIDSEYGFAKKYLEYKSESGAFVLKFNICQNDKACQTDFGTAVVESKAASEQSQFFFPDDDSNFLKEGKDDGLAMKTDSSIDDDAVNCRPNSMIGEFIWKCETKHCDKCNNNTAAWTKADTWQKQTVDNIWNGGDFCLTCLGVNNQPLNQQQTQLREDVSHDGEQLLSDLSSLQKCYMDELPTSEISCDISELMESKDRKRRHSNFYEDVAGGHRGGSWSFASRLKEDCLIQMSTIPTLRSVTL